MVETLLGNSLSVICSPCDTSQITIYSGLLTTCVCLSQSLVDVDERVALLPLVSKQLVRHKMRLQEVRHNNHAKRDDMESLTQRIMGLKTRHID